MRRLSRVLFLPVLIVLACTTAARAGSITMLLDPYFRIQDALVDDRIDTIKARAALVMTRGVGAGVVELVGRLLAGDLRHSRGGRAG